MSNPRRRRSMRAEAHWLALCPLALLGLFAACGLNTSDHGATSGTISVVAAENSWGSIAAQLGGGRVVMKSIVSNPDTDPHAYEAKPDDAKRVAQAGYVIYNGAGYDPWAPRLLKANPVPGRRVLSVADVVARKEGDNPHFWYSPDYVNQVIDRITADLQQLDPANATYFEQRRAAYKTVALRDYTDTIRTIRQRHPGVPVGATESIFGYAAQALGLDLVTPAGYMKAISEGTDPSAADKAAVDDQIARRRINVLVFNSQNTTPDVKASVARARALHIPVVAVTETLAPASAQFQDWQTGQLKDLLKALGG